MTVWNNGYYVRAYELARDGHPDKAIAQAFGVAETTLSSWKTDDPYFYEAISRGRGSNTTGQERFADFVYDRLSKEHQDVWDRINGCESLPNAKERIEALLQKKGETTRQHLFVYALVHSAFDYAKACRAVSISRKTLDRWILNDLEFRELLDEIQEVKRDWVRGSLFQLVSDREPGTVRYAANNLLANEGFGEKKHITKDVTQNINQTSTSVGVQATVALSTRDIIEFLDPDTRAKVFAAIRLAQQKKQEHEHRLPPPQSGPVGPVRPGLSDPVERLPDRSPPGGP